MVGQRVASRRGKKSVSDAFQINERNNNERNVRSLASSDYHPPPTADDSEACVLSSRAGIGYNLAVDRLGPVLLVFEIEGRAMAGDALLKTPLYDWHRAHQGRLVEFGGWSMPVQYSTIIEEHNAVRRRVGLFDISHMGRLKFRGAGRPGVAGEGHDEPRRQARPRPDPVQPDGGRRRRHPRRRLDLQPARRPGDGLQRLQPAQGPGATGDPSRGVRGRADRRDVRHLDDRRPGSRGAGDRPASFRRDPHGRPVLPLRERPLPRRPGDRQPDGITRARTGSS